MQLKSINVYLFIEYFIWDVKFEINELVSTTFRKPFDYRNKHIWVYENMRSVDNFEQVIEIWNQYKNRVRIERSLKFVRLN